MAKHRSTRRRGRRSAFLAAAASASVLVGWGGPIAHADTGTDSTKGGTGSNNPVSDAVSGAVGAVRNTVGSIQTSLSDVGGSLQGGTGSLTKGTAGLIPQSPKTSISSSGGLIESAAPKTAALLPSNPITDPIGTQAIDIGPISLPGPDINLPGLPDNLIDVGPGFGNSGEGNVASGANLGGLNFFFIGDDNFLVANNIGTGLQFVTAGDRNVLAGNQVIVPTSFGTNFVSMGDDNGNLNIKLPPDATLGDLLNLNLDLEDLVQLEGSGNNLVLGTFSFGNNLALMGNDNDGSGNNIVLGAFNLGNNMARLGNDSDHSGNNVVSGVGSFGSNMVFIGDGSQGSGNNFNDAALSIFGAATNIAIIGNDSDLSGNNNGAFNFVLIGNDVDDAGNNEGLINFAIFPDPGQNCHSACVNFFGTQFGS
jgi:hypothetical protein